MLRWGACGCGPFKDQLEKPWILLVEVATQPRYTENKECILWPSYKGANDWKCCTLVPKTEADKKEARKSIRCILNVFEARMSLILAANVGVVSGIPPP